MQKTMSCLLVVPLCTVWGSSAPSSVGVPIIVFKQNLRGQTLPISVSYTPVVEADFRVSVYLTTDGDSLKSCGSINANWTDEHFGGFNRRKVSSGFESQGDLSAVLHSSANNPITVSTGNCNETNVYDIFVTIEKI